MANEFEHATAPGFVVDFLRTGFIIIAQAIA